MKTWKKVGLVLPLVIFIISLYWVMSYMNRYDKEYYDTVFYEQVERVNHVVEAVDGLKDIGLTYAKEPIIFDGLVSNEILRMNETQGISACIVTLGFDYVTPDKTNPDLERMFNLDNRERNRLVIEMEKTSTGEIWVNSEGQLMKIYWREMPTINPGYYVVLGVDNEKIVRNVNIEPLKVFTFVISIVTLVSIYDSLFLRIKSHGAEK